MAELERIEVTRIERNKYRWYRILAVEQNWRSVLDMHLSPGELLELVAYAEENRTQLEQEAEEDEKRNARLNASKLSLRNPHQKVCFVTCYRATEELLPQHSPWQQQELLLTTIQQSLAKVTAPLLPYIWKK